jgi:hypothetical protein
MQKTIVLVCAALAIPAPGVWAQAAQAGSAQDNQEIKQQIKQDVNQQVKQMTEDMVKAMTTKITAAASGGTFLFVGGQLFNGKPVKGQPYSAEAVTETTQTLADGNRIVNRSSSTIYRDSDGRERREESIGKLGGWSAQGEPAKVVFISDPVAGFSYTLHAEDHTAEKMPAGFTAVAPRPGMVATAGTIGARGDVAVTYRVGAEAGAAANAGGIPPGLPPPVGFARRGIAESASSTKTEDLGQQTIEGVVAQGTRMTAVIPAGQIGNERDVNIVSERWFSNELGVVVMSKQSDPRAGETVYKLTNVNRSEPQHSMFEVPADYTVNDSASLREQKLRQEKLQIRKEEQ